MQQSNILKAVLNGAEVKINSHKTALHLPKSDSVLVDCELGCCYEVLPMPDFIDEYCEASNT
jgi:hypothetical protein